MSERLKPCPLCGGALAVREEIYQGETYRTAYCDCGFALIDDGSLEDFIHRTNRRTPDIVRCVECKHEQQVEGGIPFCEALEIGCIGYCSRGQRRESEEPNG